ncbi:MAG: hypothetical protein V3R86_00420 [Candidatus Hydrothermarchaeaceae archaeon]
MAAESLGARSMATFVETGDSEILNKTKIETLILDHHFLRDMKWQSRIKDAAITAEKQDAQIQTAAEYRGLKSEMLEARRKELYDG